MVNKIIVPVSKFQAKDGKVFHDELSAIYHEKLLDGEIKICTYCKGNKKVDSYGDGRSLETCHVCKGKGYLVKTILWL